QDVLYPLATGRGIDHDLVVLALATQPLVGPRNDYHMNIVKSELAPPQISADQEPQKIECDGSNLEVIEGKQCPPYLRGWWNQQPPRHARQESGSRNSTARSCMDCPPGG